MSEIPSITTPPVTPPVAPPADAAPPASSPPPSLTPPAAATGFPENWKTFLPKEFQEDPALKVIHDVPSLAKSYVNAQKMVGADKIAIPSKHATEDDWKAVFQKLGQPAELKDYSVAAPKDVPFDADTLSKFKEVAHASGVLPKQAEKILEWYGKSFQEQSKVGSEKHDANLKKEWDGLKTEWGAAFENKVLAAQIAFKEFADPEVTAFLEESKLGNNPKLMRIFAKIGETLKEDQVKGSGGRGSGQPVFSPAEAKKNYGTILADTKHPYHDKMHPNHQAAIDEVQKLFQMAYPQPEK